MPTNPGQLSILTTAQAAAIDASGAVKVAELVKISWPSPDNPKVYSWWNCLADAAYTTPLTAWLASAPLVPGFVADSDTERFHNLTRTSAIGDDVIQMSFTNVAQTFETLCYKHRGGVKVEVFYFFPEIADDAAGTAYSAVSWFLGHLRTPESCDADFVNVAVANGFRSPHLLLPNRPHASNCTFYFGGELTAAELVGHPCDYDRHLGGTRGTLNGGSPWTDCDHTKTTGCISRLGDTESYGGDETVIESTLIGGGEHQTVSVTVGNENRLKEPIRVVYGERKVRAMQLLSYAKEFNPSEDHQDAGTIRTLFEVSEGSVQSISNVKVMDRDLPRPDGLGLESRLGTQRQSPTTFASSVSNYNRRAHFRGDLNPFNPNGVRAADITAECDVVGRDTVRVYSNESTFVAQYTNLRAWCLLDLLTNQHYGHRMDKSRFLMSDFIYLAGKGSTFNCDVQGTRTVQQQVYDICLAGRMYLPFNYNGKTRILPIEDVDLTLSDIPVFTDTLGASCNILWDRERNVSRLSVSYKDDDQIPNALIVTIEDADHQNIERPLTFEDWQQQYRAGLLYGDKSKRKVETQYAAYGITHVADARALGEILLEIGPFGTGGILNNCSVEFAVDAIKAKALNLHENKVIKVVSSKLTPYTDLNDDPFEFFLITSLYRNSRLELIVKAQAWAGAFWDAFCEVPGGTSSGYVVWATPDSDVIDGPHGVNTRILSATADRAANGVTYPTSIDPANVTLDRWTHTVYALPSSGNSYDIHNFGTVRGFKIWYDGSGWIYHQTGTDFGTALPAGTIGVGDTLAVEYDYNSGSPVRRYKRNGAVIHTDTSASVSLNSIYGICNTTGDTIGDVFWEVTYSGCASDFLISPVGQGGGSTTSTSETGSEFDVLAWQVFDRPESVLEAQVFS